MPDNHDLIDALNADSDCPTTLLGGIEISSTLRSEGPRPVLDIFIDCTTDPDPELVGASPDGIIDVTIHALVRADCRPRLLHAGPLRLPSAP